MTPSAAAAECTVQSEREKEATMEAMVQQQRGNKTTNRAAVSIEHCPSTQREEWKSGRGAVLLTLSLFDSGGKIIWRAQSHCYFSCRQVGSSGTQVPTALSADHAVALDLAPKSKPGWRVFFPCLARLPRRRRGRGED